MCVAQPYWVCMFYSLIFLFTTLCLIMLGFKCQTFNSPTTVWIWKPDSSESITSSCMLFGCFQCPKSGYFVRIFDSIGKLNIFMLKSSVFRNLSIITLDKMSGFWTPFKMWPIWQPNNYWPFEYLTCWIFRSPLYVTAYKIYPRFTGVVNIICLCSFKSKLLFVSIKINSLLQCWVFMSRT